MSDLAHEPSLTRSSDGTAIAARVMGGGAGIPLLVANGIGAGLSIWRSVLARHAAERTLVTWDHRGLHGSGLPVDDRLEPARHAEDALAALDHAGVARCVVAAWSSGGRIALEIAGNHPERVAGLILVCAGYGQPLTRLLHLEAGPLLPRVAGLAKPFAGSLQSLFGRFVARPEIAGLVRQSGFVGASADTSALVELLQDLARCDARTLLAAYEAVSGAPAPGSLARISLPALVIAGDRDRFSTLAMMRDVAAKLPAARLEVYEGATHFLPIESPARLAADIRTFCAQVEDGSSAVTS